VFIIVSVYFVMGSVRKLLDTLSYIGIQTHSNLSSWSRTLDITASDGIVKLKENELDHSDNPPNILDLFTK